MQKRSSNVGYFLIFLVLSIVVFSFSRLGLLRPVEPLFQVILAPVQSVVYGSFNFAANIFSNSKVKELENQNISLTKKLINQNKLMQDNKALRDQFNTKDPKSINLTPARVVGAPGFMPGLSVPESFTVDKGEIDGIRVGDGVVVRDNLIGRVSKTTQFLSNVMLISNSSFSFTAKTSQSNALGVVKGQGGGNIILDNVILSDTLRVGDTVVTKGDLDISGNGFVPDLIIGKITAVSKNPSDLFQRAQVKSLIDITNISSVFIVNFQ